MRIVSCIAACVAFWVLGAAMSANIFSVRDLPVQHMTDEDMDMLRAAVFGTLDRTPEGTTVRWENPKTGAHCDLTPRASFERAGNPAGISKWPIRRADTTTGLF